MSSLTVGKTSHQGLPLQCPTASLGHHAEDGASNTDAEGMKIPAIAVRFPASRDSKSGCGGNTAASTSSHCLCNIRTEGEAKRTGKE